MGKDKEQAGVPPPTMTEALEQYQRALKMDEQQFIRILQLMQSAVITQVEARTVLGLTTTRQQRRNG
jgi:hypothetical protein